MSLANALEPKFGRFAIPQVIRILAIFQVVVWLMVKLRPEFLQMILLNRPQLLDGQVWRLVTWVMYPGDIPIIFIIFSTWILFMISDALDGVWGAFRVNLYLFGGMLAVIFQVLVLGEGLIPHSLPPGLSPEQAAMATHYKQHVLQCVWFSSTLFLAFAVLFPNVEFMIFFVLPVKVKYLAMITGGVVLLTFIGNPTARLPILFAHLNFIITFAPMLFKGAKRRAETSSRRLKFESAKLPAGEHFHKCHACGKTDAEDPRLEFRVSADGEEYCTNCRNAKAAETTGV